MSTDDLKKSSFEVLDNLGNRYPHKVTEIESVKVIKNGLSVTFINGDAGNIWKVSLETFLYTVSSLNLFCRIHNNTAVNIDEICCTNQADMICKMKSKRAHSFSESGWERYRLMKKIIEWIKPVQKEFPFPD